MLKQKVRFVLPALLAALATLLAMSPARADIWSGSWDPQYGAPFTTVPFGYNLGWGGKVKVNDDACTVPFGGGTFTNAGACGGGAFVVPGTLIVTLYGHPNLTPVYNTLVFNSASLLIDQLRYDSNSKLIGFSTTTESNFVFDSLLFNPPNGAGTDADFAIQFVLDGAPCLFCGPGEWFDGDTTLPGTYSGPVLFAGVDPSCGEGEDQYCDFYRSNVRDFPAEISFTPEPASLALIAGGLLAAGLGTRRRCVTRGKTRSA